MAKRAHLKAYVRKWMTEWPQTQGIFSKRQHAPCVNTGASAVSIFTSTKGGYNQTDLMCEADLLGPASSWLLPRSIPCPYQSSICTDYATGFPFGKQAKWLTSLKDWFCPSNLLHFLVLSENKLEAALKKKLRRPANSHLSIYLALQRNISVLHLSSITGCNLNAKNIKHTQAVLSLSPHHLEFLPSFGYLLFIIIIIFSLVLWRLCTCPLHFWGAYLPWDIHSFI